MYQLGQIINDRYEVSGILEPLALGQLYRAIQRKGGLHTFLWVVGPRLLPDVASRQHFVQVMTRAYGARHPNVLPLCDLFTFGEDVCLALQYLEGPTLTAHLEQRRVDTGGPLQRGEAWGLIESIASAVSQFHQLNMLIGALRPEALLMTRQGVMLRDPGVGMAIARTRFLAAAKHGRAWSWLAPELREKRPVDATADIYSLAALSHLILYGSPHPWPDGARRGLFASIGRRLRFGARPKPPEFSWPLVDTVLRRALEAHPRGRPYDVETFCRQVQSALIQSPDRPLAPVSAPVPKSAAARTMSMPASSSPADLPAPPAAPPVPARTLLAPIPARAPAPAPAPAPTMMAPAPAPAPTAPAPAPADAGVMTMDADLPPSPSPQARDGATRQLDSNEINSLLEAESRADQNKTREVSSDEINRLLAATREEDPPKKP